MTRCVRRLFLILLSFQREDFILANFVVTIDLNFGCRHINLSAAIQIRHRYTILSTDKSKCRQICYRHIELSAAMKIWVPINSSAAIQIWVPINSSAAIQIWVPINSSAAIQICCRQSDFDIAIKTLMTIYKS